MLPRVFLHQKKKRALVLFELLIALSLSAVLLTCLFSFLVESTRLQTKIEKAKEVVMRRSYVHMRLQNIFSALDVGKPTPCFYTKHLDNKVQKSLFLNFDHKIDPDPSYSGVVSAQLFIDSQKNLALKIWPIDDEDQKRSRKEILLPDVEKMELSFLGNRKSSKEQEINANLSWKSKWPKSDRSPPSMIRISIYQSKNLEKIDYAFILPSPDPFITYFTKEAV